MYPHHSFSQLYYFMKFALSPKGVRGTSSLATDLKGVEHSFFYPKGPWEWQLYEET